MTEQSHKDFARQAWLLYDQAQDLLKTMLHMFLQDFMDLDEERQRLQDARTTQA